MTGYGARQSVRDQAYAKLVDRLASGRFLELQVGENGAVGPSLDYFAPTTPAPSIGGPSIHGAPRSFAYAAAAVDTVARALSLNKKLDRELIDLMAFHDVRYLLFSSPRGPILPRGAQASGLVIDPEIPALTIDGAAPVTILEPGTDAGPAVPVAEIGAEGLPPPVSRNLIRASLEWLRSAQPRPVVAARAVALPNRFEIDLPDLGPVTIRIARNHYPRTEVSGRRHSGRGARRPWEGSRSSCRRAPTRSRSAGPRIESAGVPPAQWALAAVLF
jgi:hypothetical protein